MDDDAIKRSMPGIDFVLNSGPAVATSSYIRTKIFKGRGRVIRTSNATFIESGDHRCKCVLAVDRSSCITPFQDWCHNTWSIGSS